MTTSSQPTTSTEARGTASPDLRIDRLQPGDWPAVAAIYAAGIATCNATFETAPPTWERFDASHLPDHRLVARAGDGEVVAWAALAGVSDRCVYAGLAENSIYVAEAARGMGVGRRLLTALLEGSERAGIWTVRTGIFPGEHRQPGPAPPLRLPHGRDLRAHRPTARPRRDVLLLERRSARAGR